jgi:hypothetical protein
MYKQSSYRSGYNVLPLPYYGSNTNGDCFIRKMQKERIVSARQVQNGQPSKHSYFRVSFHSTGSGTLQRISFYTRFRFQVLSSVIDIPGCCNHQFGSQFTILITVLAEYNQTPLFPQKEK